MSPPPSLWAKRWSAGSPHPPGHRLRRRTALAPTLARRRCGRTWAAVRCTRGMMVSSMGPRGAEPDMEIGIDSFAAAFTEDSRAVSASDRIRNLVEQIEHADRLGLDSFGIGEHHR